MKVDNETAGDRLGGEGASLKRAEIPVSPASGLPNEVRRRGRENEGGRERNEKWNKLKKNIRQVRTLTSPFPYQVAFVIHLVLYFRQTNRQWSLGCCSQTLWFFTELRLPALPSPPTPCVCLCRWTCLRQCVIKNTSFGQRHVKAFLCLILILFSLPILILSPSFLSLIIY